MPRLPRRRSLSGSVSCSLLLSTQVFSPALPELRAADFASRPGHHSVVDSIRPVGRLEKGAIASIDTDEWPVDAARRQRWIASAHAAATTAIGVRAGGRAERGAGGEPDGGGAGGVPSATRVAAASVEAVHHGGRVISRVRPAVVVVVA